MKNTIFLAASVLVLMSACQQKTTETDQEIKAEPILENTIISNDGKELKVIANQDKNILTLVLDGDSIALRQDTVASGVSASNEHYRYSEWKGAVTLEKEGEVIFKKD